MATTPATFEALRKAHTMAADHQNAVLEELASIVDVLSQSWTEDLYPLRVSMAEFDSLAPALSKYPGAHVIQDWYLNHLLAGVRRLVDHGSNAVSIRRALDRLKKIADELTSERVAAFRQRVGAPHDVPNVEADMARELERYRPGYPIGKSAVQADLDLIKTVGDQAYNRATHTVAHRLSNTPPPTVERDDVEGLLTRLSEIYTRWSVLLRAVDVHADPQNENLTRPVVRALELFDWREYVEAISDEQTRVDGNTSLSDLEGRVYIRFCFEHDVGGD